ncbi:MAG: DUF4160 domain-containing protein [Deltaproteobacteria bacterium]|nr:DUF4160 domain-containing protein [Deltaproteobacteria bacterium]
MSPTVFRYRGYRFFFFSREERRVHVHVHAASGEAKFWVEPEVELAQSWGLAKGELNGLLALAKERRDEITECWKKHFGS